MLVTEWGIYTALHDKWDPKLKWTKLFECLWLVPIENLEAKERDLEAVRNSVTRALVGFADRRCWRGSRVGRLKAEEEIVHPLDFLLLPVGPAAFFHLQH